MMLFGWFSAVIIAVFLSLVSFASWVLHSVFENKKLKFITIAYSIIAVIFWYLVVMYFPFSITLV